MSRGRPAMYPFLYVEDDPLVARSMMRCFAETPYRATLVTTVAGARAELAARHDLTGVLSDFHLQDGTGLDLLLEARARTPRLPVLLVTGDDDGDLNNRVTVARIPLLRKPFDPDALMPFFEDMVAFERCPFGPRVMAIAARGDLSARELEVLQLSLDGSSVEAIAAALGISTSTVKTHRANVLRKVGASDVDALRVRLFGTVGD